MINFQRERQFSNYDCGASALVSVLSYYDIDSDETELMKIAKTNKKYGTSTKGVERVLKKFKLKYKIEKMNVDMLKEYIRKKIPVIICLQAWEGKKVKNWQGIWASGHYVIPIGYEENKIYFDDPYRVFETYLTSKELEDRWHDKDFELNEKEINLGIAVFGKHSEKKPIHMD